MSRQTKRNRPKNLNLFTIRLPINAMVSIMHRASGMLLFLAMPFLIYVFQAAVKSEASYLALLNLLHYWVVKLMMIGVAWAFFHHFYAGLRHLSHDVLWISTLQKARFSSRVVLVMVVVSVSILGVVIW